ncbi:HAMP domain-containing sensor histidine kinase [Paenibacillus sp. MMS20-IR301]|uniref:sensor histidine kinase n=1 Tax=Paenibacillus sp. MMS20-IR301 TaxID=2895946 RepID=UPI0028E7528A|nr:HAMP domain-containing sensor histidine kinase [Paenibacillus sp. MMS20-IR301]WNS45381.1 HAMP domain-containing sensor histidine kinase [Paenibacillus sp. MMS20-IR301]
MKVFDRLILWTILAGFIGIAVLNGYVYSRDASAPVKAYRVEVNRMMSRINEGQKPEDIVLKQGGYTYVNKLSWVGASAGPEAVEPFFAGKGAADDAEFTVKPVYRGASLSGYVRFDYTLPERSSRLYLLLNLVLLAALGTLTGGLLYIRKQILQPFHTLQELPFELSRGQVNTGMKEHRSRFFGRFVWGLDLLRQTLEGQKQTNLRLEKDRQTLVASLSHELKTPVAAIRLYASALDGGLYDNEEKRRAAARLIGQKAEQIEQLIGGIITASVSSLHNIEIVPGEFYISGLIRAVIHTHKERLTLLKTDLQIEAYADKLLLGDQDRLLEVMNNLIENAIKYGDGLSIRITFREEDYRQLIVIENSGEPLLPGELPYIFTSFWRGSNADGKPGNGLGLFICKQLLQKMGGDIYAEPLERGMRFVLVLRY